MFLVKLMSEWEEPEYTCEDAIEQFLYDGPEEDLKHLVKTYGVEIDNERSRSYFRYKKYTPLPVLTSIPEEYLQDKDDTFTEDVYNMYHVCDESKGKYYIKKNVYNRMIKLENRYRNEDGLPLFGELECEEEKEEDLLDRFWPDDDEDGLPY